MKWLLDCIAMQGGPELRECFRGTRTPAARREVPTMAELRVLRSCPNPALRWMILCGSEAGLRSGAAYGCTLRNCLDGRIMAITKNGVVTNTPTSPRLQALLAIVPAETPLDTQVVHALEGAPVAQKTLRRRWWEWKKRCNVRSTVRMHDLRRSLARRVYDTSHDLRQVQALLSHANLTSTLWYLDAGQPELEDTNLTQAIAAQEDTE
jgi:integrase